MALGSPFALSMAGHVREVLAFATDGRVREPLAYEDGPVLSIDYAAIGKRLDALEARALSDLREVIAEWKDALVAKVRRADAGDGLAKLAQGLKLPKRGEFTTAMNEALRRAWAAGNKDARAEVRARLTAVREHAFNPNQPRHPKGSAKGGEWLDVYHGTANEHAQEIIKNGLTVQKDKRTNEPGFYKGPRGNAVFVSTERNHALSYAVDAAKSKGTLGVVLHFRVPPSVAKQFKTDGHDLNSLYKKGSLPGKYVVAYTTVRHNAKTDKVVTRTKELAEEGLSDFYVAVAFDNLALFSAEEERVFEGTFTPRAALRWLAEKAFWITGLTADRLLNEAKGVLLQSIKTGRPIGVTILALAEIFEPYLGKDGVSVELGSPFRLETIVRTNNTDAYNHGRLTDYVSADMLPFLKGVRYSATLDTRTTEVCRFLHGRVFKPDSADLESLIPPNHFNCRSIIVPIVVGEAVNDDQFITPEQVREARELADAKFLTEHVDAWRAYREAA